MPLQHLSIEEFLAGCTNQLILDVRSPSEYEQAHIHGAVSFPLFTDEERKKIGTTYKQQSREQAIKYGLDFFGPRMRSMVEEAESLLQKKGSTEVYLHCWRGGMRSGAVAWLLNFYGFNVFLLEGGYKAYRNWVLQQFEMDYDLRILGGYTGSGKTPLLHQLLQEGQAIIDLEGIASHKGSAFGALGQPLQPRQEMFENLLATSLHELTKKKQGPIWIEDESQRIGVLNIPHAFWNTMRNKPVFFLDIPFDERLTYITNEYGGHDKEKLVNAIIRIQKRLGPVETKTAIGHLLEDNFTESFRILLSYYDKHYGKALYNRENITGLLNKIPCSAVDTLANTQRILTCEPVRF